MSAKIRQFKVLWRGDPILVEASVESPDPEPCDLDMRVRVFSVQRIGKTVTIKHEGRDLIDPEAPKTHVDPEAMPKAEGSYAIAFSSWPQEDRFELYRLVRIAARHES